MKSLKDLQPMDLPGGPERRFTPVHVRVNDAGYIPSGMSIRVRADAFFFTADCESWEALQAAKKDPKVVSVEVSARGPID